MKPDEFVIKKCRGCAIDKCDSRKWLECYEGKGKHYTQEVK